MNLVIDDRPVELEPAPPCSVELADSAANVLTNSAHDPSSVIPEYKVCAVRIEAIRPALSAGG